ncbi:hypothetical protein RCO28_30870 [Streptomyces sp. LHD-70]|uniref:hypothetical protein n=1 Tax=Streptomyces sp. LHD-70 TaxID=3072140 RepID=UPI00280D0023|nr:hypothetical protein [Streptomyces sp. LHD-70]MDQ8706840.1 hypothetical protein [Streptomyces sp. LHD-70]
MAWDEWEQLKAEAAEKHSTGMQLNGVDTGGLGSGAPSGSDVGVLAVSQKDLAAIGNEAFQLYNRLWDRARSAGDSSGTTGSDLSTQGFAIGSALTHVSNRWDKQLKSLMDACAHISNHLEYTKKTHRDGDHFIARHMSSISALDEGFNETYAKPGKQSEKDN